MTAFSAVLAAGLVLLALAAVCDLLLGVRRPRLMPVPYLLGAAGAACLAVAGAAAVGGRTVALRVTGLLGPGTAGPAADRLSGLFLVIAFGAAFAVSLALASWAAGPRRPGRRGLGAMLRPGPRRGRGGADRPGRVHAAVRLGDPDALLLPARRL